ncbi:hypothetical protein J4401_06075 [Candidatus Woesearchaeota archaeon]|nr:hypothetical protein [Candidatus Woesearchaeota archaeon]
MDTEAQFDDKSFDKMEKEILAEVMENSKSIIETFKFRMIFGVHLDKDVAEKTSEGLKEFRQKNWDTKISQNDVYKKYLNLY